MKKTPTTPPASPATPPQNRELQPSPMATSPLPSEILLQLGAIYADREVAAMLGNARVNLQSRGVQAGLVVALHAILPPAQFRAVIIQWEVDAIKLSEFLHLAGVNECEAHGQTIEA